MAGGEAEEDWLRMEVDAEFVQTAITWYQRLNYEQEDLRGHQGELSPVYR